MQHYDLIIVGGGLVGAGLAAALRDTDMRIALIDARLPSHDDPRLFGLNIGSCHFLKHLDIWDQLSPYASAIHAVHVSSQGRFGSLRLRRDDVRLPSLGYVVPAKWIELALNEKLQTQANCKLYQPAQLISLTSHENESVLEIDGECGQMVLSAPIVIGADGTASTIREQSRIQSDVHDYHQTAIVTRLKLDRSHQQIAYERFVSQGAIALLPLPEQECACIWSTETLHADTLMSLSDAEYMHAMQSQFGSRAGRFVSITQRHAFPLRMVKAQTATKDGVYLLGNAAHTFHPIAAQGFNLALYEVAVLVEAILAKHECHESFTFADMQSAYEQTKKQQSISMGISHGLANGILGDSFFQGMILQAGMTGLNLITPLKKRLLDHMLGRVGRVPQLLLGEIG